MSYSKVYRKRCVLQLTYTRTFVSYVYAILRCMHARVCVCITWALAHQRHVSRRAYHPESRPASVAAVAAVAAHAAMTNSEHTRRPLFSHSTPFRTHIIIIYYLYPVFPRAPPSFSSFFRLLRLHSVVDNAWGDDVCCARGTRFHLHHTIQCHPQITHDPPRAQTIHVASHEGCHNSAAIAK